MSGPFTVEMELRHAGFCLFIWEKLFCFQFIPVIKAEFSASLIQSSVSHDSSENILKFWFAAQETFIIINVKNGCYAEHFLWKRDTFFNDFLVNKKNRIN